LIKGIKEEGMQKTVPKISSLVDPSSKIGDLDYA